MIEGDEVVETVAVEIDDAALATFEGQRLAPARPAKARTLSGP
jgi:hypothetical protein